MTTVQSIWGNGYHTGVRETLAAIGMVVLFVLVFWALSKHREDKVEVQPPNNSYLPQQPLYLY